MRNDIKMIKVMRISLEYMNATGNETQSKGTAFHSSFQTSTGKKRISRHAFSRNSSETRCHKPMKVLFKRYSTKFFNNDSTGKILNKRKVVYI